MNVKDGALAMNKTWPIRGVSVLVWVRNEDGGVGMFLKVQDFRNLAVAQPFINASNAHGGQVVELNMNDGSTPIKLRPTKMLSPEHRLPGTRS